MVLVVTVTGRRPYQNYTYGCYMDTLVGKYSNLFSGFLFSSPPWNCKVIALHFAGPLRRTKAIKMCEEIPETNIQCLRVYGIPGGVSFSDLWDLLGIYGMKLTFSHIFFHGCLEYDPFLLGFRPIFRGFRC